MHISIPERLQPFLHEPGSVCWIPGVRWYIEAYPTCLYLKPIDGGQETIEVPLAIHGPVREFTLQLDLKKGHVKVWGMAQEGAYALRIFANAEELVLHIEKFPVPFVGKCRWLHHSLYKTVQVSREWLSLGNHKAQDWGKVVARSDFSEFLPFVFAMSQCIPVASDGGAEKKDFSRNQVSQFLGGLRSILVPAQEQNALLQQKREGFVIQQQDLKDLSQMHHLLREQFIRQQGNQLIFLIPREFPCGKMKDIVCEGVGTLGFEWASGKIRKIVFSSIRDQEISIHFDAATSFRVRTALHKIGSRVTMGSDWKVQENTRYLLDQFHTH